MFFAKQSVSAVLPELNVGGEVIEFVHEARNLGLLMDSSLRFKQHMKNIRRSAKWKLSKITKLKPALTKIKFRKIVETMVLYPMLYAGSVWGCRISAEDLNRANRLQRQALKLVDERNPLHFSEKYALRTKWATITQLLVVKIACMASLQGKV